MLFATRSPTETPLRKLIPKRLTPASLGRREGPDGGIRRGVGAGLARETGLSECGSEEGVGDRIHASEASGSLSGHLKAVFLVPLQGGGQTARREVQVDHAAMSAVD